MQARPAGPWVTMERMAAAEQAGGPQDAARLRWPSAGGRWPVTTARSAATTSTWEYREVSLPRGTGRDAARAALVEAAELGRWELARLRLYPDGRRKAWLRRRILRATRTA